MKNFFLLALIILNAAILSAKQQTPLHPPVTSLRQYLSNLVAEGEVTGMALCTVRNGQVSTVETFGFRNAESRIPIQKDTVFEAASLSKPVVSYAILALADNHLLKIDDPISKYIDNPDLHDDPRWENVTIRMLLDHTSGLPNELHSGEKVQFFFEPGTRFSYSGMGYTLIQQIIETVTRLPFEKYIEKSVFEPLRMYSSSFVWRNEYESKKANGHDDIGRPTAIRKPLTPKAPSSLHTTASDYARFIAAVLRHDGLSEEAWAEMLKPQVSVPQNCVVCIHKPGGDSSAVIKWGLGWGLVEAAHRNYLFHWGENNGDFQAYVQADPRRKYGVVVLTNSGNGLSIVPAIMQKLFGQGLQPFHWMGYDTYDSPYRDALRRMVSEGADKVIAKTHPEFNEAQWNRLGYNMLARARVTDAIEVFQHNVSLHPNSSNTFDSLGEAYAAAGQDEKAIESYKKSLLLDPTNNNAKEMIRKLERQKSDKEVI